MTRREFDRYETPREHVEILLEEMPELRHARVILEPCVGDHAIANVLREKLCGSRLDDGSWLDSNVVSVITNDIDPTRPADHHMSAAVIGHYVQADWIVTNVPFRGAVPLLRSMWRGLDGVWRPNGQPVLGMASILPYNFLEPGKREPSEAYERGRFLLAWPPSKIIPLRRHSFTGKGSAMHGVAWFIWTGTVASNGPAIQVPRRYYA